MLYHILSTAQSSILKIENIGFSADPSNNRFGPGKRNLYLIHYVISGSGFFNGHKVTAGQDFLITPHMLEHYFADTDDPWEYLWITSTDEKMNDIFKLYNYDPKTNIFSYNFVFIMRNITETIKQNHNNIVQPTKILEMFLHILNYQIDSDIKVKGSNAELYFDFSKNYIQSNLHKHITVTKLTELLGISQPYLYKLFIAKTGLSPKEYINKLKLFEAKKMLTETDMSITEISNSLGCSDVLAFSKFFSIKENVSPLKYRQSKNIKTQK